MKRQILRWLIVPTLCLLALLMLDGYRRQTPAYILAHYPHDQTFDNVVANHLDDADFLPNSPRQAVFLAAWFDGESSAYPSRCFVRQNGKGEFFVQHNRSPVEITEQSNLEFQFDSVQVAAMHNLLVDLSPNAPAPPLDELLILSFWHNRKWTTRVYNRAQLPVEVARLYQIVGIPGVSRGG